MKKRVGETSHRRLKKKCFIDFSSSSSLTFVRFKNGLPNGHLNTNTLLVCLTCVSVCHSYSGKETFPSSFSFKMGKATKQFENQSKGGEKKNSGEMSLYDRRARHLNFDVARDG